MPDALLQLALIGVLGAGCQWLAWQLRLPSILFLLLAGLAAGTGGLLSPDLLLGDLLLPLVSLAVAVILFEGGLTLRLEQIRHLSGVVCYLVTVGALCTWLLVSLGAFWLLGVPHEVAMLFGALAVVSGPTVISPMLRAVRPITRIAALLRWEGVVIDPLGAMLAVVVFDFVVSGAGATGFSYLWAGAAILLTGTLCGLCAAWLAGETLRRHLLPEYMHNMFVLVMVIAVYVGAESLRHESGLLAVTLMGIGMANMRDLNVEGLLGFKESLTLLLISSLFIVLAARVEPGDFMLLGFPTLLLLVLLPIPVRFLVVLLCTLRSGLHFREKLFLGWIAPRGVVAAAISSVFALRLEELGIASGELLVPMVLTLILSTVFLQGVSARFLARRLGVAEPEPHGVLIIGCGEVARAVGKALQENGVQVLLADSAWKQVREARMQGLPAYFGSPVSEHADRNLDLAGLGLLFAMSERANLNVLATIRFRREFGSGSIYELKTELEQAVASKHRVSRRHRGTPLFGGEITYGRLVARLRTGSRIRATQLSEMFNLEAYRAGSGERSIELFAINPRGELQVAGGAGRELRPGAGWTVLSMVAEPPLRVPPAADVCGGV